MGKATLQSKFVPVNLNESYGQEIPSSASQSSSSSSSFCVHKARSRGGMVLLTRSSSSSLSTHCTPKLGTPCLVNSHKENVRNPLGAAFNTAMRSSVWSRQQTTAASRSNLAFAHTSTPAILPDSRLGPCLSHMKENTWLVSQNVKGKLPLVPCAHESNASTYSSALAICNKYGLNRATHKHTEPIAVLREKDFPSLQMNPSSQVQSDVQQKQKVHFSEQDQQKKLLGSCQQQMHLCESGPQMFMQSIHSQPVQPLEAQILIREPSILANDEVHTMSFDGCKKSGKFGATPDQSWADDEREILHQGDMAEGFPSHEDKGLRRLGSDVNDQAGKCGSQFEFEITDKDCRLIPECVNRQFSVNKDKVPLTHSSVADFGNIKDVFLMSNALDRNHYEDNTWNLDKLRRSLCASAKGGCLQRVASGSNLQQILEHWMLGSAKPDFGMESIFGLDLNSRRRKKEEAKRAEFKDLARESFEAELERVQQTLEQERLLVLNGKEEAFKPEKKEEIPGKEEASEIPEKEQEDQKGLLMEKELQLELREDIKEAGESAERKSGGMAIKEFSVREVEKKKMLEEEEKRKERAFKKLLDLEERIARREAEKSLAVIDKLHSSSLSDCEQEATQLELSVSCSHSPIQEHLHRPMVDGIKAMELFSSNKNLSESSLMSDSSTTGQKLVSASTPCFPQDGDNARIVSQRLCKDVQLSSPSRKVEALSVNSLLYCKDKEALVGIKICGDDGGKETLESIKLGACSSMTNVPQGLQVFEKPQVVVSENGFGRSELYKQDCNELIEEASLLDIEGGIRHKTACRNLVLKHSLDNESGETWLKQEEEQKPVKLATDDSLSAGESLLEMGYSGFQKLGATNVETVSSTNACDDLRKKLQDVESGEIVVKYSVVKEELKKPFRQVVPDMIKKASKTLNIDLNSCFQETREELVQQPSPLLWHADQAAEVMQQDDFSSHKFSLQSFLQPWSIMPVPLSQSASFPAPENDLKNQQEALFQLPVGLNSAAPFMLHAIQIGSIQMPLINIDSCMPQLLPLHGSQNSLLQFGQLYSTSTVQLTLPTDYIARRTPQHHEIENEACVRQNTKLVKNRDQMLKLGKESPVLSGNDQIACQAASLQASTLQFGQLFSTVLNRHLSLDPSFSCLVEAKEKPPQLQVQAESLCLQGLASNIFENHNPFSNSAEESLIPSSGGQLVQHKTSLTRFCYNGCVVAPEVDRANLTAQEEEKIQSSSNDDFPAVRINSKEKTISFPSYYNFCFPGRKKKGYATACAKVLERRYWRVSTVKTKYVEVSHSTTVPGLGDHKCGNFSRYVYRKKEISKNNGQQELKINQQAAQTLCSDLPQNKKFEKAVSCQIETAASMHKNSDTDSDLLHRRKLEQQRPAEVMPTEYGMFEQQGIETPATVDDFIEVKSRRQILRKQRMEEEEVKLNSKIFRVAAQQRVLACSATKQSLEPSQSRVI